jgi:hypothetical protein
MRTFCLFHPGGLSGNRSRGGALSRSARASGPGARLVGQKRPVGVRRSPLVAWSEPGSLAEVRSAAVGLTRGAATMTAPWKGTVGGTPTMRCDSSGKSTARKLVQLPVVMVEHGCSIKAVLVPGTDGVLAPPLTATACPRAAISAVRSAPAQRSGGIFVHTACRFEKVTILPETPPGDLDADAREAVFPTAGRFPRPRRLIKAELRTSRATTASGGPYPVRRLAGGRTKNVTFRPETPWDPVAGLRRARGSTAKSFAEKRYILSRNSGPRGKATRTYPEADLPRFPKIRVNDQ